MYPKLPIVRYDKDLKGYRFEKYNFNGWVYHLEKGTYNIIVGSCPDSKYAKNIEPCDFLLRVRSQVIKNPDIKSQQSVSRFNLTSISL